MVAHPRAASADASLALSHSSTGATPVGRGDPLHAPARGVVGLLRADAALAGKARASWRVHGAN
eukprot:1596674-Alexandrium_andersonii.AAC.1